MSTKTYIYKIDISPSNHFTLLELDSTVSRVLFASYHFLDIESRETKRYTLTLV